MVSRACVLLLGLLSATLPYASPAQQRNRPVAVHCKGGYRSSIATSILRRAGFEEIADLTGGYDAWKTADLQKTQATA